MSRTTPKIIDLFSGVGGISLGAAQAGFNVAAAVELDKFAAKYHAINFPQSNHLIKDVSTISGQELLDMANIKFGDLDGLVGGPPCHGFSDMGLKCSSDPRNKLLFHFFRLVAETRPAFFLAENVPGLIRERNKESLEEALSLVPSNYKVLNPIVLKANDFGAPTTRTRVFFIGYDPSRVNTLQPSDFLPKNELDTRVAEALSGLPAIRADWQNESQSWRAVSALSESFYSTRIGSHDQIPSRVGDPVALELFRTKRLVSGFLGTLHLPTTIERFKALKPGEADQISKCVRLNKAGYCPTLRAGTGSERGSFQAIRPVHPTSPRVISPREAARLQGFPDWYQFHPTKWHAFRQIGNSVSPFVSEAVLSKIYKALI